MANPPLSSDAVLELLRQVQEPRQGRDIVALNLVHDLAIREGSIWLSVRLGEASAEVKSALEGEIRQRVSVLPGVTKVEVKFDASAPPPRPQGGPAPQSLPGVKYILAVGSGKGGVGKTTVAVNLSIALAEMGSMVGLLDADVYGPNVPRMMGINEMPRVLGENRIEPLRSFGVRLMSMGFLSPGDKPIIWRGPMLHSAMQQFLRQVDWGGLDYLIIDLPPGTGDIVLSLAQSVALSGAVVVTTPSDVALEDGRKALLMFQQLKIPILGVVENMSYFACPHCHQEVDIFSHGGGELTAEKFGVPFLGALPLLPEVRQGGDSGQPVTTAGADAASARPYFELARAIAAQVELRAMAGGVGDILHVRA